MENPSERQGKLRWLSLMRIVVGGLLLLPMNLLLRLVVRLTRTLFSSTSSLPQTNESSMDSFSKPSSSTMQRSGSSLPIPPIQGLSERDLIGLSLMKPLSFQEQFGSNTLDQPSQIDGDGLYSFQRLGDTTGYMISTREGSLMIIQNGTLGNTPVQVQGTSGIT